MIPYFLTLRRAACAFALVITIANAESAKADERVLSLAIEGGPEYEFSKSYYVSRPPSLPGHPSSPSREDFQRADAWGTSGAVRAFFGRSHRPHLAAGLGLRYGVSAGVDPYSGYSERRRGPSVGPSVMVLPRAGSGGFYLDAMVGIAFETFFKRGFATWVDAGYAFRTSTGSLVALGAGFTIVDVFSSDGDDSDSGTYHRQDLSIVPSIVLHIIGRIPAPSGHWLRNP